MRDPARAVKSGSSTALPPEPPGPCLLPRLCRGSRRCRRADVGVVRVDRAWQRVPPARERGSGSRGAIARQAGGL